MVIMFALVVFLCCFSMFIGWFVVRFFRLGFSGALLLAVVCLQVQTAMAAGDSFSEKDEWSLSQSGRAGQPLLLITVHNVVPNKGYVYVNLFHEGIKHFPKAASSFYQIRREAFDEKYVLFAVRDSDLRYGSGRYAVSVYQDVNNNGFFDVSLVGFPQEPFGFSGQFDYANIPPSFHESKFYVRGSGPTKISIDLVRI